MPDFEKTVPFDPGYSKLTFSFVENIALVTQEYNYMKANHQKKFWLTKFEPVILDLINKSAAFYLGCMLWGGFIHSRFKENPKEIVGNNVTCLNEEERKNIDCASEVKAILQYIQSFNRDCKYFLNRPAKISAMINEILENYIEFSQINNNFLEVNKTSDVKLPKSFKHFDNLTNNQLDDLCEKIYAAIDSNKIDLLLQLGFYNI